jgi:hypothetical protein
VADSKKPDITHPDRTSPITLDDLDRAPSALPTTRSTDELDPQVLRKKFDELSVENFNLKDEIFKLRRSVNTSQILDSLLEPYARKAFWFMCTYSCVVCAMLIAAGLRLFGFQLDAGVLQVLAGSTAVTVIGLVGMVLTGIFVGARK